MSSSTPPTVTKLMIPMSDGVRLAATLYLPDRDEPAPALLEALPYRKDDILGAESRPEYARLRDEHGYAVCRVDVRGTGSSEGLATDEYPAGETDDLCEVIAWLAAQPWCSGAVGMFGTSYSGFNSLHVAMRRPPALKAIVPIYSSDDRFTDDVHYMGGALRLIDLVDYPAYMSALNALPPVPALAGAHWREKWQERLENTEPWLLSWLEHQRHGPFWQRGSVRPHYDRIACPTMIVAGWADGYRNNSFRTVRGLAEAGTPYRLVIGPWSHMATDSSLPGPHSDLVPEMARWFDRWLRGTDNGIDREPPIMLFTRRSTRPEPDLAQIRGAWRAEPQWPPERGTEPVLALSGEDRVLTVRPSVGTAAWNDCAGSLPWGQPTDQRYDDADSLTWEWGTGELADGPVEILGHPRARLSLTSTAPVAYVSVKLCDVFPDGTSALITRGVLNLTRRNGHDTAPVPLIPGVAENVTVELNATSWILEAGHRLRMSVAGTDWPNIAAPPEPCDLTLHASAGALHLPLVPGAAPPPASDGAAAADPVASADAAGVTWRIERDVLARTTTCAVGHGSTWATTEGTGCEDRYTGRVTVDDRTFEQTVTAHSAFTVEWPEATVTATADLHLMARQDHYETKITVRAFDDGRQVFERHWRRDVPRDLG
ncbi:CocE/NonD family hydrolase [Streptomyces sp. NPDC048479]|uniref:CocE/NonD family hydrolase n=1 Tax=Streptomyces sp. NPDC048479 TaxID=3154725 RepID=UPI003433D92F